MTRNALLATLLFAMASTAQAADDARALIDAVVFFGGLIVLLIVALALRIRDARAGLSQEQRQARMKRRLPWIMGVFFGLCAYSLLSSV